MCVGEWVFVWEWLLVFSDWKSWTRNMTWCRGGWICVEVGLPGCICMERGALLRNPSATLYKRLIPSSSIILCSPPALARSIVFVYFQKNVSPPPDFPPRLICCILSYITASPSTPPRCPDSSCFSITLLWDPIQAVAAAREKER